MKTQVDSKTKWASETFDVSFYPSFSISATVEIGKGLDYMSVRCGAMHLIIDANDECDEAVAIRVGRMFSMDHARYANECALRVIRAAKEAIADAET